MNYIGSKVSLIDFLYNSINDATGYKDGDNYIFADVFAGTGALNGKTLFPRFLIRKKKI